MELFDRVKIGVVVMILTFLLSPGLIFTLPPRKMSQSGLLGFGILSSKETHILSMVIHSLIISVILIVLLSFAPYLKDICGSSTIIEDLEVEEVEVVEEVSKDDN